MSDNKPIHHSMYGASTKIKVKAKDGEVLLSTECAEHGMTTALTPDAARWLMGTIQSVLSELEGGPN